MVDARAWWVRSGAIGHGLSYNTVGLLFGSTGNYGAAPDPDPRPYPYAHPYAYPSPV